MRSIRLLTLPAMALALGACSAQWPSLADNAPPSPETTASVAASRLAMPRAAKVEAGDSYRLDSGDRVRVVVSGQDALSGSYDVDPGGAIEIPSLGKINARGLNTVQLSGAVARRLRQHNVREASVAAQIETFRPFSIKGDVANPGQYPYVNNMTAETAIAIAGGLKPGADKSSVSVNRDGKGKASALTSPVRPGDTLVVTEER